MKSHAQGKKHQSTIQGSQTSSSTKQFFTVKDTATASTSSKSGEELPSMQPSSGEQKGQMQQFVSRKDQHMAEIRWALKTVMSHYSLNSAQDIADVFRACFLSCLVVQQNCHILSLLGLHLSSSKSF